MGGSLVCAADDGGGGAMSRGRWFKYDELNARMRGWDRGLRRDADCGTWEDTVGLAQAYQGAYLTFIAQQVDSSSSTPITTSRASAVAMLKRMGITERSSV